MSCFTTYEEETMVNRAKIKELMNESACSHNANKKKGEGVITSYSIHYTKLYEVFFQVVLVEAQTEEDLLDAVDVVLHLLA